MNNVVGRVGSFIWQGVYSVATPFHPFGGAVDIIVVQQQDGTFRTTPWYVRFGKFQGVLKGTEKFVRIAVNGEEANFHMFLDNSGEAYFVREVASSKDNESNGILKDSDRVASGISVDMPDCISEEASANHSRLETSVSDSAITQLRGKTTSLDNDTNRLDRAESDLERKFYDFQDEQSPGSDSLGFSEFESNSYEGLDGGGENDAEPQMLDSEVVLVCVDDHFLIPPISASEGNTENVELSIPQFHLGPGEETDFVEGSADLDATADSWENYEFDEALANVDANSIDTFESISSDQLEVRVEKEMEGESACRAEETQNIEDEGTSPLRPSSVEDCSYGIQRKNIFKSCLELPDSQHIPGEAENSPEKSPCSHSSVEVHEHVEAIGQTEYHGLSPCCTTNSPGKTLSSDITIENEAMKTNLSSDLTIDDELMKTDAPETAHLDSENAPAHTFDKSECKDGEIPITSPTSEQENESQEGESVEPEPEISMEGDPTNSSRSFEISLCRSELHEGMVLGAAAAAFDSHVVSEEEFKESAQSIIKHENLIVRYKERYYTREKAAAIVLGMAAFGLDKPVEPKVAVQVEQDETPKLREGDSSGTSTPTSARRCRLWPIPFRRVKTIEHTSSASSNEEVFVDSESGPQLPQVEPSVTPEVLASASPQKQLMRTNVPTSDQIATLNLKDGQNIVTFSFSTRVLGKQQVDARIYLWKWNARIVISDVDGTITKSDVLGQFMPLVGKDWTQSGVTQFFNAIKENGYQLLFLSARAIVQAYLTRSYLLNLKQDGNALPKGPVVISPDGLFPSLFREVIRRTPHEFKIACLEDIRALFPADYNPFYAGFGNRDTDELSYRKMGIPKGKIFIINPKGEVASSHRTDVWSYASLHTLVNDMFPPTSLVEQEDYNSWNYWRVPIPEIE